MLLLKVTLLLFGFVAYVGQIAFADKLTEAKAYLEQANEEFRQRKTEEFNIYYNYNINVTKENQEAVIAIFIQNANFYKQKRDEILSLGYQNIEDENIKRQVKKLTKIGYAVLSNQDRQAIFEAIGSMQSNYAKIKVCSFKEPTKCDLSLEPDIEQHISDSRDPEELKYYWTKWYDNAGTPVRNHFNNYIHLSNKAAVLNGFPSAAEVWIDEYEDDLFPERLEEIYGTILPFYQKFHAYIRYKLRQKYGDSVVSETGPIPMHLLGNMWGQSWDQILDITVPFPDTPFLDVTGEMVRQGYTPIKMFEMGDEFFQSLNMTKLPDSFWKKSVLEKPTDGRDIICHASAWDFYTNNDVRIKQCTRVTMQQLYVVHHELGHIQYYLQYQHQPAVFRRAPNPGFHEAVGDVLELAVETPRHLKKIGLIEDDQISYKSRINQLFRKASKKLAFLPFAYTMDKYRWAVFRGQINSSDANCAFWNMRSDFGGVEPPVKRTESDFDPPAKYHLSADVEYLRYFCSHVFQFQFYKAACAKAGQYVPGSEDFPLDQCDIYQSPEAGNAFKELLSLGSSKHWRDALEVFTGEREINISPYLEYFQPLFEWLDREIVKHNISIGWEPTTKCSKD